MRRSRLPKIMKLDDRNDLAVQLYIEGASVGNAGKKAGVSTNILKQLLRARGVSIRKNQRRSTSPKTGIGGQGTEP